MPETATLFEVGRVRIVAGKFRRRKLLASPGLVTRPMTDRAKETLFERLGHDIAGKRVADVFAGTGTIGLEALSRAAAGVVFIENDHRAFDLLKQNVSRLEVEPDTLCWRADALRSSFRPQGVPHLVPFDLVFLDPPYRMIDDLRGGSPLFRSMERMARPGVTSTNADLVLRTPRNAEFEWPTYWGHEHTFVISSMDIHVFRKATEPSPGDGEEGRAV